MPVYYALKEMLEAFASSDDGLEKEVYNKFYCVVESLWGPQGTVILTKYVDAVDDMFYVPDLNRDEFLNEVFHLPIEY